MSPQDREHRVWVLPLLRLHNSQVLSHSEPEKEAMQRWAPSPSFVLSGPLSEKVVAPACFIANASVSLHGPLSLNVYSRLRGGLWVGGTALHHSPPLLLGRFSCLFPAPATPVRRMCVCAFYGKKKKNKREGPEWTWRGKCTVLFLCSP